MNFASHELSGDSQEQLQAQAAWLKQYSNVSITVEGHCDERGTREYNIALGERRAQTMKNYLIGLGVSANRLSTLSYGKERHAVLGSNESAWAQKQTGSSCSKLINNPVIFLLRRHTYCVAPYFRLNFSAYAL